MYCILGMVRGKIVNFADFGMIVNVFLLSVLTSNTSAQ